MSQTAMKNPTHRPRTHSAPSAPQQAAPTGPSGGVASRAPESRGLVPGGAAGEALDAALAGVAKRVPPVWPLHGYVAVNPMLGWSDLDPAAAHTALARVAEAQFLPPLSHYRAMWREGRITPADLQAAVAQSPAPGLTAERLAAIAGGAEPVGPATGRAVWTVAEAVDARGPGGPLGWRARFLDHLSTHCAAQFDQGQAGWPSPWAGLPLWESWKQFAQTDLRMELEGLTGFRASVAGLPDSPRAAIAAMLASMGVPAACYTEYLLCLALSIAGWASFVRRETQNAAAESAPDNDLVGLVAARLAYDAALAAREGFAPGREPWAAAGTASAELTEEVAARAALLAAAEHAYRAPLVASLAGASGEASQNDPKRPEAHLVFCIDVRSEVLRRHLERVAPGVRTGGFAGFFGAAMELVPLGAASADAYCPVLIAPSFTVVERAAEDDHSHARATRGVVRSAAWRRAWAAFRSSAASCFSFVESFGWTYLPRLVARALPSAEPPRREAGPDLGLERMSPDARIAVVEGMLRRQGLAGDDGAVATLPRLVVFCGHEGLSANNPHASSLHCGACGGKSGEPNARVAATLANDPLVRAGLAALGPGRAILLPDDTRFVAAVHNTTTDQVTLLPTADDLRTHAADLASLEKAVEAAGRLSRAERAPRLGASSGEALAARARDWSEVRPEWGLAGCAAFVAAPRRRTAGLDLRGRVFLHDYDERLDPRAETLAAILTAPVVVASWINLQYFAAASDNAFFGGGDKTLHNIVGGVGVLEGAAGDLRPGLPLQSVHTGARPEHEPLRLAVVVEAAPEAIDRVLAAHPGVAELFDNGWLRLVALRGDAALARDAAGRWTAA